MRQQLPQLLPLHRFHQRDGHELFQPELSSVRTQNRIIIHVRGVIMVPLLIFIQTFSIFYQKHAIIGAVFKANQTRRTGSSDKRLDRVMRAARSFYDRTTVTFSARINENRFRIADKFFPKPNIDDVFSRFHVKSAGRAVADTPGGSAFTFFIASDDRV